MLIVRNLDNREMHKTRENHYLLDEHTCILNKSIFCWLHFHYNLLLLF